MTRDEALALFESAARFTTDSLPLIDLSKLEPLYSIFPPSTCACDDIGKCCRTNLLFLSSYEWHNAMEHIKATYSDDEKAALTQRWVDYQGHFENDPMGRKVMPCSLLDEDGKQCKIHSVRPMPCRAFGGIEGSCVDCKRDKSVPFNEFSENVREMESFSAKMLTTEGEKIPIALPLEIWFRVAIQGLPDAMAEFYQSPWYEETKRGQTPFGRIV